MQTFLPDPDFATTAAVLDRQRLGNQRNEALVILRTILEGQKGWAHHPAVLMWVGHTDSLIDYSLAICREWVRRGYVDNTAVIFQSLRGASTSTPPPWLGDPRLHSSHRAALLHKNPRWYSQFGWPEAPVIDYTWPRRWATIKGGSHADR